MPEYDLIHEIAPGVTESYRITPEGLFIGRHTENHITIPDNRISRRHARVWLEASTPWIEDLGSRNGVCLNGKMIQRSAAVPGDVILLGECVFRVRACHASTLGHAVISTAHAEDIQQAIMSEASGVRLPVLYRAAKLLGTVFDVDELLNQILALIFEALPVSRGFILVLNGTTGEPEVHAHCSRSDAVEDLPLSRTLIQHVYDHREAILTLDAQEDSRFLATDSIMGHRIHAAMCAPLLGHETVAGAIYVDGGEATRAFSPDDLGLLTAIAQVVGVAVENARLYRENVERARLAAVGQATAGIGHCIKNILTGIRGGSDFIERGVKTGESRYIEKGLPILSRAVERIDMLVMNMLAFSKPRVPERYPQDLTVLINEALDMVRSRAERYKINLVFAPPGPVRAKVDGREIYRVVLNLLTNALEACEAEGGTVTVQCEEREDDALIRIRDTGMGIPANVLPGLFQAFSSTKGSSGTGLGLACSQKIVQEHGGTIEVKSEPGHGAIFTVFLPSSPRQEA